LPNALLTETLIVIAAAACAVGLLKRRRRRRHDGRRAREDEDIAHGNRVLQRAGVERARLRVVTFDQRRAVARLLHQCQ